MPEPVSYDSLIETLTFLFTDVEGSTTLLRRLGDTAYSRALEDHHRIVRRCLEAHGGHEEGTQGDAFFAAFSSTTACVAAALEMQIELRRHDWPDGAMLLVRMGIHTGEASEAATGLVGYEVHRAARIASVGYGGQILLSSAAAGLVENSLPNGVGLRSLGIHRLKDLGRPEALFQLEAPDLRTDFPPLRSLDNPELPNNLPASLTPFIGRSTELAEVRSLILQSRLVTLTGAGGSGKTRLALQVAAEFLDGSGEGVWLVELAPVTDPDRVADATIDALQIRREPELAPVENLQRVLRDQRSLIILDNGEHLIDSVAKLADAITRTCPKVHLVVTSREPLGVDGEDVYRVRSLTLPTGDVEGVADLAGSDSVELFMIRTRQHDKSFTLSDANAPLVASICRRLDGIPLAIELAAARLSSMSLEDLHGRLDQRFRLLSGGSRGALPRQQTLGAMVAWSYDLLNEFERAVLRRLTVFADGFDLRAAEAVCATEAMEAFDVTDIIGTLVSKSLVMAERSDASLRYRLLETIRQFAADQLLQVGGEAEMGEARQRHAEYYLGLCDAAEPHLRGSPDQAMWIERMELDWENLHSAFVHFANDANGAENVLRLGVSAGPFFSIRQHREAFEFIGEALVSTLDVLPTLRAQALAIWAENLVDEIESGDAAEAKLLRALAAYGEALELARRAGDIATVVDVLCRMSYTTNDAGDLGAARVQVDEAATLARNTGDPRLIGIALMHQALVKPLNERKSSLLEAAVWLRRAGDSANLCLALLIASVRGSATIDDIWEDRGLNAEALQLAEEIGYRAVETLLVGNLGFYCYVVGERGEAAVHLRRCVQMLHRAGWPSYWLWGYMEVLAWLAADRGDLLESAQLFGARHRMSSEAPEFFARNRQVVSPLEEEIREDVRRRVIEGLGEQAYQRAVAAGERLTTNQFVDMALGRAKAKA